MIKAVVFDIGNTLVTYNRPQSWINSYRPALEQTALVCGFDLSEADYGSGIDILTKYNTRINPRDREVSSEVIFKEILSAWGKDFDNIETAKNAFYSYFRSNVSVFDDVEETLKALKLKGILTATLSDVPYGMDNEYILADIADIIEYIDLPYTSNDVGYRKTSTKGLLMITDKLGVEPNQTVFAGDEDKDVCCANGAGAVSVLIDREGEMPDYGQAYTINSLSELIYITEHHMSE